MDAIKVTDPTKMVTDPLLLAHLERQGIDKDYVELTSDYGKNIKGKSSPYAKFYQDLKSGARFMVISQLPMADADGNKIEVGWEQNGDGFVEKNNLFKATVKGQAVELIARNDQPDGRKAGDLVEFNPQLFFDNAEVSCLSGPTLLPIDPANENYSNNVLEWDYGICKRRLRIIEGKLLGSWVFEQNPNGSVRIKYNQSGDYGLRLGQFRVSEDEELVTGEQFNQETYPCAVSDSATFYPDAHAETSSVDGYLQQYDAGEHTWAWIRDGAGLIANDSGTTMFVQIYSAATSNTWYTMGRAAALFNTASLPDGAIISSAVLSLYGSNKADPGGFTPDINIYSSAPASDTALVAGDYDSLGTTAFSTAITYAGWSAAGYNDFTLNASGIAAITKTGVSKFGMRNANHDVANSPPTWSSTSNSFVMCYTADQGTGYKPKLVITYTEGEAKTSSDSGSGAEAISLRELGTVETGSGVEASLAAAALLAGDGGSGSEMGGLLQDLFSQDQGGGADNVKILIGKAGYDLKLHAHRGQVSITHKEVTL